MEAETATKSGQAKLELHGADIIAAIKPHVAHKPDVRYVPIEEARSKMGPFADAMANLCI